ncbi:MAG: hypothetical protein LW826_04515 [Candidatus Jidaibacter sp.]|jgi:hypothetical protein|nr:hypothetical protein [Candidatus Jidaibacter sp.]
MYHVVEWCSFNTTSEAFYIKANAAFDMIGLFKMLHSARVNSISLAINTQQTYRAFSMVKAMVSFTLSRRLSISFTGQLSNQSLYVLSNKLGTSKTVSSLCIRFHSLYSVVKTAMIGKAVMNNESIINASYPGRSDVVSEILSLRSKAEMAKKTADKMIVHAKILEENNAALHKPCPLLDSLKLNFGCTISSDFAFSKEYHVLNRDNDINKITHK